ncbi:hypothetical protein [Candidatus Hodarchaeum mangrovi]
MSIIYENNSLIEYFRPRGKIVCVGDAVSSELRLLNEFLNSKTESRIPLLLLAPSTLPTDSCDQAVIFDSEKMLSQVQFLLNSYFIFFVFNSSEIGIFQILGSILASIEFSDSIPLFFDTGPGLKTQQINFFGPCYFHFDFSSENNRKKFKILLDSLITSLNPNSGLGISFPDLIQIFGNSKILIEGIAYSTDLDEALQDAITTVGDHLVNIFPEEFEKLQIIFISVISSRPISLHSMNKITKKIISTFGKEIEIRFTNAINSEVQEYNVSLILTDFNPVNSILPRYSGFDELIEIQQKTPCSNNHDKKNPPDNEYSEEEERFNVLSRIFSTSEVYIFDDSGLPLFASHKPAGQEVCLYTGLFSAIQSMSSDLIGHTPDFLSAGDKQCVFLSQAGPSDIQLRGVAVCTIGQESVAKSNLLFSMNLVKKYLEKGEPEYAINDKIQGLLVSGYKSGALEGFFQITDFHAS